MVLYVELNQVQNLAVDRQGVPKVNHQVATQGESSLNGPPKKKKIVPDYKSTNQKNLQTLSNPTPEIDKIKDKKKWTSGESNAGPPLHY